jgi:hypothetical protein
MIGRQLTWEYSLPDPTYEKLDRVLMDSDWEQKYSLVSVSTLPQIESLSDHAPLLLTTGIPSPPHKRPFKFELGWLQREGFSDMVKNIWDQQFVAGTPIQRWNTKLWDGRDI